LAVGVGVGWEGALGEFVVGATVDGFSGVFEGAGLGEAGAVAAAGFEETGFALTLNSTDSGFVTMSTLRLRRYFSRLRVAMSGLNHLRIGSLTASGMRRVPMEISVME
jgi:hypothetical protein